MADNLLGEHVQGCLDEGQPYLNERPVEIAGRDAQGLIKVPLFNADGSTPVSIVAGGGGPVSVADCADVTQGCIADAAVTGDNPGTVSAKLRGLSKILFDVWDSVNHWLRVGAAQVGSWTVAVSNFPATQPVSGSVDVTDRAARLLGHTTVDNFPATQPVSGSVDVTDRTARLLGHTTVDNFPATQPVSGTVTVLQGSIPWVVDGSGVVQPISGTVTVVDLEGPRRRRLLEDILLELRQMRGVEEL